MREVRGRERHIPSSPRMRAVPIFECMDLQVMRRAE